MGMMKQSYPTLHYKIFRLCYPRNGFGYHLEVFDSNNWAWKLLKDILQLPDDVLFGPDRYFLVNYGGFYWLTNDGRIFIFNVDEVKWITIELPHERLEMNNNLGANKMVVDYCEGKIGVFYTTRENDCEIIGYNCNNDTQM
ncbi:hypothetical protein BVC80_9063g74 [Macleaya cordata]|uniref:F-box associated domain n=1 Tax=Macleaya cordata TaxID=56857 RepID=A0A200PNB4_MACCD|nr:hypothetical protein BVC80_9063g74 [Macleaya cordata]